MMPWCPPLFDKSVHPWRIIQAPYTSAESEIFQKLLNHIYSFEHFYFIKIKY